MTPYETTPPAPTEGMPNRETRFGVVGMAGQPNVGKSTLVNRLVGQKVSIVSERPQTTRERVCGIYTDERMQVVLMDIPGITQPRDKLGTVLLDWVETSLRQSDLVLHLRDARDTGQPDDPHTLDYIKRSGKRCWLAWNKIDRVHRWALPPLPGDLPYERQFALSALTGAGLDELMEALQQNLPAGPMHYDPEQICDRDLRFLVAELVREQLFRRLGQEVPYGTAALTEAFEERADGKTYIRILILTEREAHKPILIGKGGAMLKEIGKEARQEIEQLVGQPVFLELWVKVRAKWRSDERQLGYLGLKPPDSG